MEDWRRVDEAATIENFYREHARAVYAFSVSLCRDPVWAEDLMQDTFSRATRALPGYRGGNPRSWLFAIAKSVFIDDVRKHRPEPSNKVIDAESVERDLAEVQLIEMALATLTERQRTALLLADEAGLAYSEIAPIVNGTPAAVKVLIHRARINFRNAYQRLNS
jgi:RNA polymerase sigma-70 factor (ECF subfamily)